MILILILTLAIVLVALELRRRVRKKAAPRGGGERYRAARGNLNLSRPGRNSKPQLSRKSLAAPILLSLVLLLLGLWLAASYLLPGSQTPVTAMDSQADAAPPVQTRTLAGRLVGDPPTNGALSQSAQATVGGSPGLVPLPPANENPVGPLAAAARAGAAPSAPLDQLGRRLGAAESQAPAAVGSKVAAANKAPQPSLTAPPSAGTIAAVKPRGSSDFTPAAGNNNLLARSSMPSTVSASPGSTPAPGKAPAGGTAAATSIFSAASRNYTVHLASFQETGNAEKYLGRLNAAGETAFISEATVQGVLWHRVMSGRFGSKSEAEAHGRNLKRRGLTADTGSFVIKALD